MIGKGGGPGGSFRSFSGRFGRLRLMIDHMAPRSGKSIAKKKRDIVNGSLLGCFKKVKISLVSVWFKFQLFNSRQLRLYEPMWTPR